MPCSSDLAVQLAEVALCRALNGGCLFKLLHSRLELADLSVKEPTSVMPVSVHDTSR